MGFVIAIPAIGVFNIHGRYVAVLNLCPHELAPVCLGRLGGTTLPSAPGEWVWGREGEILREIDVEFPSERTVRESLLHIGTVLTELALSENAINQHRHAVAERVYRAIKYHDFLHVHDCVLDWP